MAKTKIKTRSSKWYGWRPDTPDYRDRRFSGEARALPRMHLFPGHLMPTVRDQGAQGSCTGHMAYGISSFLHRQSGQRTSDKLAPRFAYWNARFFEGSTGEDSGAEIRDAIKGVVKFGIARESLCKYNPQSFAVRPGKSAFAEALTEMITDYERIPNGDITSVKAALAQNIPVGFGFSCFANLDDPKVAETGLLGMPTGDMDGGHAIWACGYDDDLKIEGETGALLLMNSWGKNWGYKPEGYASRGFFWMPFAYAGNRDLADDFWACRQIS